MGTIIERKRKDGSVAYRAQIVIYRDKAVVHREQQTFERRPAAVAWIAKREKILAQPGALQAVKVATGVTLAEVIDRYVAESRKQMGRTKAQVLEAIKDFPIASQRCEDIKSADIVTFARELTPGRTPQTVKNYVSHLGAVFAIAKPAWGVELDRTTMSDAAIVAKRLGLTSKSRERDRRPTVEEVHRLMDYFRNRRSYTRTSTPPMALVVPFALYSTRRQEEITRITWADYQPEANRVLVRDMKNPGEKIGNDVWVDLPPETLEIIGRMPRRDNRIFPYKPNTIGTAFRRACQILGIKDLHFHDLRHEGVSRLFEMGWGIPQVAAVSGHRSWTSLKRYTHIRQTGDKWAGDWWR